MDDSALRRFGALADPTRLRILHLLRGGELCVCDLMAALRTPQAKTSRHLAYLRSAGLVTCRKNGLWSYYSIARAADPSHRKLLECLRSIPGNAADARRARTLERRGGCCPT